jgi:hypothetical protein
MISTILVWIYIFLLTTLAGHFVFRVLSRLLRKDVNAEPSIAELSITGLTFLGVFLSYFSLFLKIGLLANILLFSACLIYFLFARKGLISYFERQLNDFKKLPAIVIILIFVYFILILIAAQSVPAISDTGLYHVQNIKWISSYKVIPGLGNLHGRFAFNNHSFLLEALFSLSFLKPDFFHLLNSYLAVIISVTLITLAYKKLNYNRWRGFLYTGLLILLQVFYLKSVSSPTPDIFSLAGIWFIFIIYLEKIAGENSSKLYWLPILLMTFFMITVKLSAFPIALISIVFLAEYDNPRWKKLLLLLTAAALVFIPYFIRNFIISGYLIYPYPSINIFNPDWKIPIQYVNEMRTVISTHAQSGDWEQRAFSEWFPLWYSHLSMGFKILSWYILISPALMAVLISLSGNIRKRFGSDLKVVLICFFAVVFWFISAPNFRFIFAFLFFYVLVTCMIFSCYLSGKFLSSGFFNRYREKINILLPKAFYVLLLLFSAWFLLKLDYKGIKENLILPAGFKDVPYQRVELNNFFVNIPDDGTYCWNLPLPSSIIQKNIGITNIEMRGPDYKYGFGIKIDKQEEIDKLKDLLRLK